MSPRPHVPPAGHSGPCRCGDREGHAARPEAPPPEAHSTRRPRPPRRSAVLDSPLPGQPPGLRAPSRGVAGFCRGTVPGRGPAGGVGAGAKVEGSRKCTCLRKGAGPGSLGQRGRSPAPRSPPLFDPGLAGSVLRAPPTRHTPKQPRLCPHCFLSPVTPTCTSRPAPTQSCLERRPDQAFGSRPPSKEHPRDESRTLQVWRASR